MGHVWRFFVKYMASYAVLMFASYALWLASGFYSGTSVGAVGADVSLSLSCGLHAVSDFLVVFAVFAYPAYAAIKAAVGRFARWGDARFGVSQRNAKSQTP